MLEKRERGLPSRLVEDFGVISGAVSSCLMVVGNVGLMCLDKPAVDTESDR